MTTYNAQGYWSGDYDDEQYDDEPDYEAEPDYESEFVPDYGPAYVPDYEPEPEPEPDYLPEYNIKRIDVAALNIGCTTTAFIATVYRRKHPRTCMTYDNITRASLLRLQRAQLALAGIDAKGGER